jgi:mannose-1-phosphate guanylyltransferase
MPHGQAGVAAGPARSPAAGVVLAAGVGRRLRPVTDALPKPLVPILNVPLLQWALASLEQAGVTQAAANVCYRADDFVDEVPRISAETGVSVTLVVEKRQSGPAGGLVACRPYLPPGAQCLVLHGDVFSDVAFAEVLDTHSRNRADLTIMATPVPDPHRFGVLRLDGSRVIGLTEKPPDASPGALVSCGVYAMSTAAVSRVDSADRDDFDFKHLVPDLLRDGAVVTAHVTTALWSDVGDVPTLLAANLTALATESLLSKVAARDNRPHLWTQGNATVHPAARLEGTALVGTGAHVEAGATVTSSVIGPGCRVEAGAIVVRSVLLRGAVVRSGQRVVDQVVS